MIDLIRPEGAVRLVFSSLFFIYGFLPCCMLLYAVTPGIQRKNAVLIFLSLFFYAWGEPIWVVLLVFSATMDYICGLMIGKARLVNAPRMARIALIASITLNLALLGTFKYLDFILENLGLLLRTSPALPGLTLPIGISFYTFQTMSYTIDVYRGKVHVQRSYFDFLLFVALFSQLVAGPILRYAEIEKQLRDRPFTWEGTADGITRFCCGLGKKVLLANTAGAIASGILDGPLAGLPAADAWFGIVMYAAQLYFDFSGYSDMAIGLGRMFGFRYGENFRHPYFSVSITDLWRRWHISLGSFFRDYVYIPLGGSRGGGFRTVRNIFITWFLTGLWHGASWNFVLWGIYHFLWLAFEKYILRRFFPERGRYISMVYTFPVFVLGLTMVWFTDMGRLGTFVTCLFGANGLTGLQSATLWVGRMPLLLVCAAAAGPMAKNLMERYIKGPVLRPALTLVYNSLTLLLCTAALTGQSYNPFIYFRW